MIKLVIASYCCNNCSLDLDRRTVYVKPTRKKVHQYLSTCSRCRNKQYTPILEVVA